MRDSFISIILTMAALLTLTKSTEIGKDGFNFYKDYLRARSDEGMADDIPTVDRTVYFYRTPLQVYPGLLPALEEQEYKKRTANIFKNHMLSKETWMDAGTPRKRSSKAALSLMLQNKQPSYIDTMPVGKNLE